MDATGALDPDACQRVFDTVAAYAQEIAANGCEANLAVLTSAVRDASNGAEFAARLRDDYAIDARVLSGDEEAQLTFLGAMSGRRPVAEPTVVIDIGGGSTEFVVGRERTAGFHVSTHAGVVRMSERHIHSDPPEPSELQALAMDTRATFRAGVPESERQKCISVWRSPAPRPRPPRSRWSSTPMTPSASTATCCAWRPSNCCWRGWPRWTKPSAGG